MKVVVECLWVISCKNAWKGRDVNGGAARVFDDETNWEGVCVLD